MKIRIASDLHLEFFRGNSVEQLERHFLPADKRDGKSVLLLAGDISSDIAQLRDFLTRASKRFAFTMYVPGNHEYYRSDYKDWNREAEGQLDCIPQVAAIVGRVSSRQFGGVRFIAGTMWSDGGNNEGEEAAVGDYLSDFRLIGFGGRNFTVKDMQGLHATQRAEVARLLDGGMPTVVMTHHMPSYSLSHPRFGSACTGGFAGKCDDLMEGENAPALWVHGHTHDTFDRRIGKTRIVCNPAGYMPEWNTEFNGFFHAPMFVEVEAASPLQCFKEIEGEEGMSEQVKTQKLNQAPEVIREALKQLAGGIHTMPCRPLASCHTSQEIDTWWQTFIFQQDEWVRSVAKRALAMLPPPPKQ